MDRRKFLKVAGVGAVGLAGMPAARLFAKGGAAEETGVGKRLALVIDLTQAPDIAELSDQAGIAKCHEIHNVPDHKDPRHEIKWIWNTNLHNAFPEQVETDETLDYRDPAYKRHGGVLVMCNHCENPACVRACPTKATFKRKEDGIVLMDFHRCIGCRFCMAACPYGARSFNFFDPRIALDESKILPSFPTRMKGVVEKCNLCAERLAQGGQPACVEAAAEVAKQKNVPSRMFFGDLNDSHSEVREILRDRYSIRRKIHLGTQPNVYYIV